MSILTNADHDWIYFLTHAIVDNLIFVESRYEIHSRCLSTITVKRALVADKTLLHNHKNSMESSIPYSTRVLTI